MARMPAKALELSQEDRALLERWLRAGSTPQDVAKRVRIVLLAAEGVANQRIAKEAGVSKPTVLTWRRRFEAEGPDTVWKIRPGRGRKRSITDETVRAIVKDTLENKPEGATHWSLRMMAKRHGVSRSTVQRVWKSYGLKPHRTKTFKLSKDPKFVEKTEDVVGLYRNPPKDGVVLCVDEKSRIQALDRTQPGLPLKRGRCGTMTHDYKRHGTTTLFAALDPARGRVVGMCTPRHRQQEFLRFLRRLDGEYPKGVALHLVLDNYGTHKTAAVKAWLAKHPRFHLHFVPTSGSWLNLVEAWFAQLSQKRLRRGMFTSVKALKDAIMEFIEVHNRNPRPYQWTTSTDDIFRKVASCQAVLATHH